MRNANSAADNLSQRPALAGFGLKTLLPLASVAILLSACGGGNGGGYYGGGGGGGQAGSTPLLQVGMQRQYTGTTTRSIVYANPTGTQKNNTLSYNFNETVNVLNAPATSGASFDVQSMYNYTITQDPGTGTVPVSETVDSYENLLTNGALQATSTVGESLVSIQSDETSNALGNGPYLATTNSTYNYTTPIPGLTFPLQGGTTLQLPFAQVVNTAYQDVNASGSAPSNGSNVAYTGQTTKNNDGSFRSQTNRVNGVTLNTTVNSDGSGFYSSTGGGTVYTTTFGVPVLTNSVYTIPVNYSTTAPSVTSTNYSAADWYPGNGAPPSPLSNEVKTVIGPVTSLPGECSGALVQPNMFEVDTTETSLDPASSYLVSTTRAFNANGVVVCSLLQETNTGYNVYTGAVSSTTTTQTTTILTGLTVPGS